MHAPTITVKALRIALALAEMQGVAPARLLGPLGLDPGTLDDADAQVPFACIEHVWTEVVRLTGDGAFGLHAAEAVAGRQVHLVDYLCANCRRPREIFELLERYQRTLMSQTRIELIERGPHPRFVLHPMEGGGTRPAQFSECIIAQWVLRLHLRCTRPFELRRVFFMHRRPADTAEHERIFQAPLEFDAPYDGIEFDAALFAIELRGMDETLVQLLRGHADALLAKQVAANRDTLAARTRETLLRAPPGGLPGVEAVARALGLGERSLQRKLRDEGTSFKDVLDEVRRELALDYLRDPRQSISEVAFLVGFSEISAFSRAFRRWTDEAPLAWRRKNTRASPPVKSLAPVVKT